MKQVRLRENGRGDEKGGQKGNRLGNTLKTRKKKMPISMYVESRMQLVHGMVEKRSVLRWDCGEEPKNIPDDRHLQEGV